MDLLILIVGCVIIGFVVYVLTTKIKMPPDWAQAIQAIALVVILLYLLSHIVHIPNVLH